MKKRVQARKPRRTMGSALVLTLFTIAALLTLGTTFIVLATNESRMSQCEKEIEMSRQMAAFGISWSVSFKSFWRTNPTKTDLIGSIWRTRTDLRVRG